MNIREIESQLGIPRANIRYYEKEGLLHPARSGNNYRVYTDEDVETLKKIRLLRQYSNLRAFSASVNSLKSDEFSFIMHFLFPSQTQSALPDKLAQ